MRFEVFLDLCQRNRMSALLNEVSDEFPVRAFVICGHDAFRTLSI
jgi:hypothetical protein